MVRFLTILALAAGAVGLGWLGCSGVVGGAARNLALVAATDSTVGLSWDEPEAGTPDNYVVYFRQVGTEGYAPIQQTTLTTYDHNPEGMTGWYRIAAVFGADLYFPAETLSTVPVATPLMLLAEFSASGNSGYGWSRATGVAGNYPMRQAESSAGVDLFVTDFALGYGGPTYSLASPTFGPSDPSGEVPQAPWRLTRFTADLPDERAPLPVYNELIYLASRDVSPGFICGVHTDDGFYGMVEVEGINTATGVARVMGWFQLVPGLRLIRH